MLVLFSLIADFSIEEKVKGGPNGSDGRELADFFERRGDGRPQKIGGQLELEPQGQEAPQIQSYADKGFWVSSKKGAEEKSEKTNGGSEKNHDCGTGFGETDQERNRCP
jgi:hypothetical protein